MTHPDPINVAIIDDNVMVRHALATLLETVPDLHVVFAGNAVSAATTETAPRVILLDAGLSDGDSLRVASQLRETYPGARIIMMDLLPSNEDVVEFVNAGVSGFALKDASFEEFIAAIRTVAAGQNVLPTRLTESLFAQIAREAGTTDRSRAIEDIRMTPREIEIIGVIGEGLSNKQIAQRLNIATHTVKSHVRNVMEKLALHSRLQIAAYSHRQGT